MLITQPNLHSLLRDNGILLDTNIFIDSLLKPSAFDKFFKELKNHNVTIATIQPVAAEFLRGVTNENSYVEKMKLLDDIIDLYLPITDEVMENVFRLIKLYGVDGKGTEMTDFLLAATLMLYSNDLFLLTKNTTDFPMHIFDCVSVINLPHHRSIQTYGLYTSKV